MFWNLLTLLSTKKRSFLRRSECYVAIQFMLTQLFLNYGCDFDTVDLYKSIVWNLSRVSTKPRMPSSYPFAAQDAALIQTGLEVLVVILRAFLKVLNLQGGDDEIDDSTSFLRSKSNKHLGIAMAVTGDKARRKNIFESHQLYYIQ